MFLPVSLWKETSLPPHGGLCDGSIPPAIGFTGDPVAIGVEVGCIARLTIKDRSSACTTDGITVFVIDVVDGGLFGVVVLRPRVCAAHIGRLRLRLEHIERRREQPCLGQQDQPDNRRAADLKHALHARSVSAYG